MDAEPRGSEELTWLDGSDIVVLPFSLASQRRGIAKVGPLYQSRTGRNICTDGDSNIFGTVVRVSGQMAARFPVSERVAVDLEQGYWRVAKLIKHDFYGASWSKRKWNRLRLCTLQPAIIMAARSVLFSDTIRLYSASRHFLSHNAPFLKIGRFTGRER